MWWFYILINKMPINTLKDWDEELKSVVERLEDKQKDRLLKILQNDKKKRNEKLSWKGV